MAASAIVTLAGGSLDQCLAASSLALQNSLGMICDPIANRVEAPCLGKNAMAAANALSAANMALAGFDHLIPFDEVLAAMDLCTLLVPGGDGTCQSLLRAAALGIPMVGTRRGAIPEIISNGQTGLLVEEDAEALASAWRRLMDDPAGRREMGAAARRDARFRFQPDRHAAWMERFYERTRERSLSASS